METGAPSAEGGTPDRPGDAGGRWALLRERDFALLLLGRLVSWTGTGMVPVALSFAILDRGGGAREVGWVLAAETAPLVVFLLIAGVVADQVNRRLLMLGADLLRAAAQVALAVGVLTGHPPFGAFVAAEAVVGTGTAWFTPAMTGLLPAVAPPGRLQQANGLWTAAQSVGLLAGPGIAGVVVAAAGPGWAIAADGGSYVLSAIFLLSLRIGWARTVRPSAERLGAGLRTGWREFRSRRWLWSVVTQFSLLGAVVYAPFMVVGAVLARDHLGGARAWGLVLTANGAGAVAGGIALLRLRPHRPLLFGELLLLWWAAPLVALAARAPLTVVALAAFAAGFGQGTFEPLWGTTMQRLLPGDVLSRVSAYDWFGSLVLIPVGYVLAGPLSEVIGERVLLLVATGWLAVTTAVVLALRQVRDVGLRAPAGSTPSGTTPPGSAPPTAPSTAGGASRGTPAVPRRNLRYSTGRTSPCPTPGSPRRRPPRAAPP